MVLQAANLAVRFLSELCVLAALGYWGFHTGKGQIVKLGLGIGVPLLAALVWAMFGAPHAAMPVHGPLRAVLEVAIFGSASAALSMAGHPALAVAFGLAVLINRTLMLVWGQ